MRRDRLTTNQQHAQESRKYEDNTQGNKGDRKTPESHLRRARYCVAGTQPRQQLYKI
jgi:hypothetical protein